jgi:hypothetical protein
MKPKVKKKSQSIHLCTGVLALMLLFIISSCATQTSNLGKTAPKNQVLPLTVDEKTQDRVWQTNDMEVIYNTVKIGDTFTIEGALSINDSVTRTFPVMKWLKFSINYLDANNKVINIDRININTGYRNKLAKNLKLINVPEAPPEAVAFAFSYWGLMSSFGVQDENPGDWEIYFDPFKTNTENQKSTGNGLFYAD